MICCMVAFCVLALGWSDARAAVSVRDYGATGDGATDDTKAFQKALEKCNEDLAIPAGRYRIAEVRIPDSTTVRGVGPASVLTLPADAAAGLRVGSHCTIRDLRIIGRGKEDKHEMHSGGCLWLQDVSHVRMERLVIEQTNRS